MPQDPSFTISHYPSPDHGARHGQVSGVIQKALRSDAQTGAGAEEEGIQLGSRTEQLHDFVLFRRPNWTAG